MKPWGNLNATPSLLRQTVEFGYDGTPKIILGGDALTMTPEQGSLAIQPDGVHLYLDGAWVLWFGWGDALQMAERLRAGACEEVVVDLSTVDPSILEELSRRKRR